MTSLGQRLALWSRRGAALGLLLSCGRFAWIATSWASERYDASRDASEERSRGGAARPARGDEREDALTAARKLAEEGKGDVGKPLELGASSGEPAAQPGGPSEGNDAGHLAGAGAKGKPKQRMLFVDLGAPRSEVLVSGVLVGHTPYAGSWTCRDGDVLVIHVLPRGSGAPIESRVSCENSIRAVTGRTLERDEVTTLLADPQVPSSIKEAFRR